MRVRVRTRLATVSVATAVPEESATEADALPALRCLADALAAAAGNRVRRDGKEISCRPGCGACCRQLVPLAPVEARCLGDVVDGLPADRRTEVLARFGAIRRRLCEEGMLDSLQNLDGRSPDDMRDLALRYFALGLPCPFLDDECCSIYDERPIACREYLVTSVPDACRRPGRGAVKKVPIGVSLAHRVATAGDREGVVPLVLALDWARHHPEPWRGHRAGTVVLAEALGASRKPPAQRRGAQPVG